MQSALLAAAIRAAAWRYPFLSGGSGLVQKRPFRDVLPGEEVVEARLRNGGRLLVRTGDFIGRAIFFTGDYDPKITWVCRKTLRPGDIMLDVGANLGVVAAYAAQLVGPSGSVHVFEPQRDLAMLVERSMRINGYDHAVVHPMALSDTDREMPIYGSLQSRATVSLEANGDQPPLDIVPARHAGRMLESLGLGDIRLLKVDVEGHEETFLRGALAYLKHNTPTVILFESHGSDPFQGRPVVVMLRSLGYEFFQIPKALINLRLKPMEGDATSRGFDYVAIQPNSGLIPSLT